MAAAAPPMPPSGAACASSPPSGADPDPPELEPDDVDPEPPLELDPDDVDPVPPLDPDAPLDPDPLDPDPLDDDAPPASPMGAPDWPDVAHATAMAGAANKEMRIDFRRAETSGEWGMPVHGVTGMPSRHAQRRGARVPAIPPPRGTLGGPPAPTPATEPFVSFL